MNQTSSELMVLEYQRDQARRELQDLEESIEARRSPRVHDDSKEVYGNRQDADVLNLSASQVGFCLRFSNFS